MKNKFLLLISLFFGIIELSSCQKEMDKDTEFSIAERQLIIDYDKYIISDVKWSVSDEYQVGSFMPKTKNESSEISVWYKVNDGNAERFIDVTNQGVNVPDVIEIVFNDLIYSNEKIWKIEEIELENRYNNTAQEQVYEMELENIANTNLKAELYFDASNGVLLFSKEKITNQNDQSDERYIINTDLEQAVKVIYPNAIIIDASKGDNQIEVDIVSQDTEVNLEVEMLFSLTYDYISSEYEIEYNDLAAKFIAVKTWLETAANGFPAPKNTDEVDVVEGINLFVNNIKCSSFIEIEYENNSNEYELAFYLGDKNEIIKVDEGEIEEPGNNNYKVKYGEMPAKFVAVKTWIEIPANGFPIPEITTEVEITEGIDMIIDNIKCNSLIEIEYENNSNEYELRFYLDDKNLIVSVNEIGGGVEVSRYINGTFILNQGNMSDGVGSLIFIDENGELIENVYELENGEKLPNLAQDMYIYNNKLYIVTQSGGLIILNAITLKLEKKYTAAELGIPHNEYMTNIVVINDDIFIRSGGVSGKASIYKFNLRSETTTTIGGPGATIISKNRMVVIANTIYTSSGPFLLTLNENDKEFKAIPMPGDRQFISLRISEDGNLWLSGEDFFGIVGSAIMKFNVKTLEFETNTIKQSVKLMTKDHPMIGVIGNNLYFQYKQDIYCHDFMNKDAKTNTKIVFENIDTVTEYEKGIAYNGIGVDVKTNKIYVNILKNFGLDYLTNDILVFDIKADKLEFNRTYKNKTRLPNGFHFTSEFEN